MVINIKELRTATEKILQHLENISEKDIQLDKDFYWEIPEEGLYSVEEKPDNLLVGQLSDDWNDIQMILNGKQEPVSYNLVDLAAILKAIGQKLII